MRTVSHAWIARDCASDRAVILFSDGDYCAWKYCTGETPAPAANRLGARMELPYRVENVLRQYRPAVVIPCTPEGALRLLSKCLLLDYDRLNFEIAPEEWVAAT